MNCLLIFDHLNDIIHTKYNEEFLQHMKNFAMEQEMLTATEGAAATTIDANIIVQTFSPIVTSHRIMSCQFGNSYTSIKCEDGLIVYFEDYMGYLFVAISKEKEDYMKWFTYICVTIVRYLCGPDVYQLKANDEKSALANKLIDNWTTLISVDQAMYVEAVEQLFINPELSSTTLKILRDSVDQICLQVEYKKMHALILVQNKVLSLYSSSSAKELAPSDILFLIIMCQNLDSSKDDNKSTKSQQILSYQVLLSGPEDAPKCLPHAVHVMPLSNGIHLVYVLEIGNSALAASLYESFSHLHTMQQVQIQREKKTLQPAFENLELATKRLHESLKKSKNSVIENSHKQLMKKWDIIKKKYQEYLKNGSEEALLRAETLGLGFLENLKELLNLTSVDDSILNSSSRFVISAALGVKGKLATYEDFFKAKSIRNFSLGSDSLTINKYLEEFPGLIHFLYVDRNSHRVTTPTLDLEAEEGLFNKKKIWFMLDVAKSKLQKGIMTMIWKDLNFSYGYFLWFEDANGQALKPADITEEFSGWPGILCEDFYLKLRKMCFPKTPPSKIRCYEVFCLHLGLVTASVVLEQTRRLAATIGELRGYPSQAVDFF